MTASVMREAPTLYPWPGRGRAWNWGLILVVAGLAVTASAAQAQQVNVPTLRAETSTNQAPSVDRPATAALPPNPDQAIGTAVAPHTLDTTAANRYRPIFALHRTARHRAAQPIM